MAASKSAVAGLEAARKRVASADAQIAEAQANAAASEQNVKVA